MNGDPADSGQLFTGVWWRDAVIFAIITMPVWYLAWAWINHIRRQRDELRTYAKYLETKQDCTRKSEPPGSAS